MLNQKTAKIILPRATKDFDYENVREDIKEALLEVKAHLQGKIKLQNAEEFL